MTRPTGAAGGRARGDGSGARRHHPPGDPVRRQDARDAFYRALAGWDVQEVPDYPDYPMWAAPSGLGGGGMGLREGAFQAPRLYVEVDSIDAAFARAEAAGGRVGQPRQPIDETSWWAVVVDSEGNEMGLVEGAT